MRIVLVISSLSTGGAERVMSELANEFDSRGWIVSFITIAGLEVDHFKLNTRIERVILGGAEPSSNILIGLIRNYKRLQRLRSAVLSFQPNVVIAFGARTNILTLVALGMSGIPVVVSERTDPFALNIGFPWHTLRPWVYRYASTVIAQTTRVADKMSIKWGLNNINIIPNPLPKNLPPIPTLKNKNQKIILSVGRLSKEKGHDVLIEAWVQISHEFPDWRLRLLGQGPELNNLQLKAIELGVINSIDFVGVKSSVWDEYLDAPIFVLPSRREGFPNALLEALAFGCNCVASDCNSGPAEILNNGKLGVLYNSNSPNELAFAIRGLLNKSLFVTDFLIAEEVRNMYSINEIMNQWEKTLLKVRGHGV